MHDDVLVSPTGDVGPAGSLCGILGVRFDNQINGEGSDRFGTPMHAKPHCGADSESQCMGPSSLSPI